MSTTVSCCFCLLLALSLVTGSQGYVRFCYFSNWAQYRVNASFTPLDMEAALCTHILYAFGELRDNTIFRIEENDFLYYSQLNALKENNPKLKLILALGGWDANNTHFTNLVATTANMASFAQSSISYLREHKFDGLDLDWEYPAGRGGPPSDRVGFTNLTKYLMAAFIEEAEASKLPRLELTAAVVAGIGQANNFYQIDQIGRYLDYINIMAYDLHGSWEATTGIHSALYPDVDNCVTGWLNAGAPAEKIVLGVAAYGRTYTLASSDRNPANLGIGQQAIGGGLAGPSTETNGTLAYFEICQKIEWENWTEDYSAAHNSPVAYGRVGNLMNWVGYDNINSAIAKAKYIRDRGLAGSMLWSLDMDDFQNVCGKNRFPLARTLLQELPSGGEIAETSTTEMTTAYEETTTTPKEETTTIAEETTKLPDETTKLPDETTKLPDETTKLPDETTKLPDETTKLKGETTEQITTEQVMSQEQTTIAKQAEEETTTEEQTTKAVANSDDSTPADAGWVTTTLSPSITSTPAVTTTRRPPVINRPQIPFFKPSKPNGCYLTFGRGKPGSTFQGSSNMFVVWSFSFLNYICTCPRNYVYNPCIKLCDFKTNRATCPKWL